MTGMLRYIFLTIVFSVTFFCGCVDRQKLMPNEYVQWIENKEHGLRVQKEIGQISYSVQYKPVDYIVAKEEKSNDIKKAELDARHKVLEKMQYFTLRIESKDKAKDVLTVGAPSEQDYYQRQNYLSFEFQNDIRLIDGRDTLACGLFQAVGNYGLAPYMDFVIGFEEKEKQKEQILNDKEFILEDKVFGNGVLKFIVTKESINNRPYITTL